MLIAGHQAMLASRLPYKRRVEYLESTGTQWIDTGILCNNLTTLEVGAWWNTTQYDMNIFGVYDNSSGTTLRFMVQIHNTLPPNTYWGSSTRTIRSNASSGEWHDYVLGEGSFRVDENVVQTWSDITFQMTAPMFLFARKFKNVNNPSKLYDSPFYGRIKYSRIMQNGALVQSLIPVIDFNDVACMYDEVTGAFFYNAGTGVFGVPQVRWAAGGISANA